MVHISDQPGACVEEQGAMGERISPATLTRHLERTSRTFALAVPLLPAPVRDTVALAYLLFRCADTLEDAAAWTEEERMRALATFAELLEGRGSARDVVHAWLETGMTAHEGYRDLMRDLPELVEQLAYVPEAVRRHTRRTALGMREMIPRARGLASLEDLRRYCYFVAGIVGELLTELFLDAEPSLAAVRADLEAEALHFGEGLQLVNILKDERDDAAEGRRFLPPSLRRDDVIALAREDLRGARRYVEALRRGGAPRGFVAFTALPSELAEETLDAIERMGAGAKVPRERVLALYARHRAAAETV